MGDAEGAFQPSKKRAAGREISRDNPGLDDEEEVSEQEMGTFKRASDEVLAARRIVKVRRSQPSSTASAPSSNPFAGIRLVPLTGSGATAAPATDEANAGKTVAGEGNSLGSNETDVKTDGKNNELGSSTEESNAEATADKEKNDGEDASDKLKSNDEKVVDATDKNVEADKIEKDAETKKSESEDKIEKDAETKKSENKDKIEREAETKKSENEDKMERDAETKKSETQAEIKNSENVDTINDGNGDADKSGDSAPFSSFQQLSSSQNAFTGLAGTGFSSSAFSFGSIAKEGSSPGSGSLFGLKGDQPSFGFGLSNNGSSSLFGTSDASSIAKGDKSGFPSMLEVPLETGEENEKPIFVADSVLFEYIDGSWKERGKGEIKVNVPTTGTVKARLVMRTRGNYRLILNASLFPDMKLTSMDKKGITFACVNSVSEGKDSLSTFALKFKDPSIVEEFRACVTEHKNKTTPPAPAAVTALKTPENSPKASDD